ncbi:hypothetical protein BDV19DRAFT_391525 [Aspergillus venezuelensis]
MNSAKAFLFIHNDGLNDTNYQNEKVKRDIRRHVMLDIGRARRKPRRNAPVAVGARPRISSTKDGNSRDSAAHADSKPAPSSFETDGKTIPPERPFWDQHPLVMLERQWEMDTFSAYGIAFVISEGRHLVSKNHKSDHGGFWFPFAFRASTFLRHFRDALTSSHMLASITTAVSKEFQIIALRRMLGTISCIGNILSGHDLRQVTANRVIRGVLACICYNLVSSDYAQAQLHLDGLERLVSARGGVMNLQSDKDLALMIFWVDVTASLLFNSKPRFSLPYLLLPAPVPGDLLNALPSSVTRLSGKLNPANGRHGAHVLLCLGDLAAVAPSVEHRLAPNTDSPWEQEESIGLDLNPIAHRLMELSPDPGTAVHVVAKALRLGQINWIILVKRICRAYPGSPAQYASTLLGLLGYTKPWYKDVNLIPAYFWLLVLCAIAVRETDKESGAVALIQGAAQHWGLTSWREVMVHVRQMPWINAFDVLGKDLERRVF